MNILYIEDAPNDAKLIALYIKTTTHHLTIAGTIAEARAAFSNLPDLLLIDVLLGTKREGYVLLDEFRAHGYAGPSIAVTGLSTPKDIEECQKAGFDYILHKPFTIDELVMVMDKFGK